jgi:hypothetical protein
VVFSPLGYIIGVSAGSVIETKIRNNLLILIFILTLFKN